MWSRRGQARTLSWQISYRPVLHQEEVPLMESGHARFGSCGLHPCR